MHGRWDGTPLEFLHGASLSQHHPGDVRGAAWTGAPVAVGSADALFPAVLFRGANSPQTVTFNLTAAQAPAASTQPHSRSVTIGTYHGNNTTCSYAVPAIALVARQNTLSVSVISGSGGSGGSPFLSPAVAIDATDML